MKDKIYSGLFLFVTWGLPIALIVFYIILLCIYGNKPVTEMPIWVWWLLGGK